MKEKFSLIIETLHADDMGDRENVSSWWSNFINRRPFLFFSFAFLLRAASSMFKPLKKTHSISLKQFQTHKTVL